MVLLIPDAVRKIKAQGRAEGMDEGRREERQRIRAALAERGIHEGNGGPIVLDRDEFRKIMNGDAQGKP